MVYGRHAKGHLNPPPLNTSPYRTQDVVYERMAAGGRLSLDYAAVLAAMQRCLVDVPTGSADNVLPRSISSSLGLVARHREEHALEDWQYSMIIMLPTPSAPSKYVPMMNCCFAAQKQVPCNDQLASHRHLDRGSLLTS